MASTTSHAGERATYHEYASWPDDGRRYEILDGEVVEMNAPLTVHQRTAAALWRVIDAWIAHHRAGEVLFAPLDVILADDTIVQPDILAVSAERLSIVRAEGIFGAPDLVVEVLSPSTGARDAVDKRRIYARHGVREYWMVDPVAQVLWQFALESGKFEDLGRFASDGEVTSRAFPGMHVKLASIWPQTLPA